MAVETLTKDNFETLVNQAELPVLVDFWAPWCGPCRMVSPLVDELGEELEGQAIVGKVNVDEQPELASKYGVMSIPTLIVIRKGEVVQKSVGAKSKEAIRAMLEL